MVTHQALVTVAYIHGLGKHDLDLEQPGQFVSVLKWVWISVAPGMLVSILARISITALLVRLFGSVHKWFKWFTIGLTTLQTALCGLIIPLTYLQVTPTHGLWNVYNPDVKWNWDARVVLYMEYVGQC